MLTMTKPLAQDCVRSWQDFMNLANKWKADNRNIGQYTQILRVFLMHFSHAPIESKDSMIVIIYSMLVHYFPCIWKRVLWIYTCFKLIVLTCSYYTCIILFPLYSYAYVLFPEAVYPIGKEKWVSIVYFNIRWSWVLLCQNRIRLDGRANWTQIIHFGWGSYWKIMKSIKYYLETVSPMTCRLIWADRFVTITVYMSFIVIGEHSSRIFIMINYIQRT